jgi:predicted ATPase
LQSKIARVLEEEFPETAPEVLAQHYTAAGLLVEAMPHWLRAGQHALERSALTEAISHLTKGLDLLQDLPDDIARVQLEVGMQATLGLALTAAKGYAAPEVELTYARAHELCQRVGDVPRLFPILYGIGSFHLVRGNLRLARKFGEQLLSLAEQAGDPAFLLMGHSALGHSLWHMGDNACAAAHLIQARAAYDPAAHASLALAYGQDFGVFTLSYLAAAQQVLGYSDEALRVALSAVALARRLRHPFSLSAALAFQAPFMMYRRDTTATLRYAEECMAVAGEQGFPHWAAMATVYRGWALTQLGELTEGIGSAARGGDQDHR